MSLYKSHLDLFSMSGKRLFRKLLSRILSVLCFLVTPVFCTAQQSGPLASPLQGLSQGMPQQDVHQRGVAAGLQNPGFQAARPQAIGQLQDFRSENQPPASQQLTGTLAGVSQPTLSSVTVGSGSLGSSQHHCGHIIELLMANRFRQQARQHRTELAPGLEFRLPQELSLGDLELISVICISGGDLNQGPIFEAVLRNNSRETIYDFRVSAVAVLQAINFDSPASVVPITEIAAGSLLQVRIQLPSSALTMETNANVRRGFDRLVIAVDSFDELIESDELNNVRILMRDQIQMALAIVDAPAGNPPMAASGLPPHGPDQQPQGPPDTAVPSPERVQSPLDSINPDDLTSDPSLENR